MRGPSPARLQRLLLTATAIALVGCSLSLRGGTGPGVGPFATPTPLVAGGPPLVIIASPAGGIFGTTGHTIEFDVRGSDPWPIGMTRMELFAGAEMVDRVIAAGGAARRNFAAILQWTPLLPGAYMMAAFAYRADGTASQPATLSLTITGAPITASPTPTLVPLITPSPFDSASPIASATASASPSPTARPTAEPTPAPIAAHIDVWVEEAELPDWVAGEERTLVVHLQNIGGSTVPFVRITATLAGATGKARSGALSPGEETTVAIVLTPQDAGEKKLSVKGKLPPGYYDPDPVSNTLVWERIVTVAPGATPVPTPTPTASPSVPPGPP